MPRLFGVRSRQGAWSAIHVLGAVFAAACATGEGIDSSSGLDATTGLVESGGTAGAGAGSSSTGGSSGSANANGGTGSESSSGGRGASGGSLSGGAPGTGGRPAGSGGANATTGGAGGATGGGTSVGGATNTGGAPSTGGATGSGGAAGTVTFGGAHETNGPKCLTAACYTPNPLAGSTCGCPSGFTAVGPLPVLDDRGCPSGNAPYGWSAVNVCIGGSFAATADFGGVYQRDATGACTTGNPMASGQCSCPAGATAIELQADSGCWLNTTVGFCWNARAPLTKFGGAYQVSDDMAQGTNGCVVKNPATQSCSCPARTTALSMRTVWGPNNSGCKNDGSVGGHLVVCEVP